MIQVNAVVLSASVTLWEGCILRVFKNRELGIFTPKRKNMTEG